MSTAWSDAPEPSWFPLLLLGSLGGASDERHQSFVAGPDASRWDWVTDNVGVLPGYGFFFLLLARMARASRPERDLTRTDRDRI